MNAQYAIGIYLTIAAIAWHVGFIYFGFWLSRYALPTWRNRTPKLHTVDFSPRTCNSLLRQS